MKYTKEQTRGTLTFQKQNHICHYRAPPLPHPQHRNPTLSLSLTIKSYTASWIYTHTG